MYSLTEAIKCDATLDTFTEDFCQGFLAEMIDEIVRNNKRINEMSGDDKIDLARRIRRRYLKFSILDFKLFVDMLLARELGEALKSVDGASIMEKLWEYNNQRESARARITEDEDRGEVVSRNRPLAEWQLHMTYLLSIMDGIHGDPNWEPYSYWNSIATHEEVRDIIMPCIDVHGILKT